LHGGNNDVNVLNKYPFVAYLLRGEGIGFMVNSNLYLRCYLLTNGTYLPYNCFV